MHTHVIIRKALSLLIIFFSVSFISPVFSQSNMSTSSATVSPGTLSPTPPPLVPDENPEVGINLSLSPIFINATTDPGQPVTTQFRITNNNNIREFLRIDLAKFEADATGAQPVIIDVEPGDPFVDWVDFTEREFTLDPNQKKTIKVTITPAQDAALGYYYAFVVSRIQEKVAGGRETIIAGSPAVPVLLEVVSPNAKRELQLVDFKTDRVFYETLPTEFKIRVKNTGNIHAIPFGDIFIDWGNSKELAVLSANSSRGNILPNTEREYTAIWNDGFMVREPKRDERGREVLDDNGNTVYTVAYDFGKANKFRIGKYTANLLLVYDNGQRDIPLEATVSFWIIPGRFILTILAIIITPAVLVYLIMRWKYGRKKKR